MLLFDDSKKLEKALGEEAAAVIAHVLEKADEKWRRELATKADLQEMRNDFIERIAATNANLVAMESRIIKWMVGGCVALGGFLLAAMAFLK
ncbi:hypothetical protein LJB81_01935 [Desulfovibrio sp. OttesenSCG-928-M14]|nr:hypothetical protein [Desulfovibrio sp. OttesenSCG-928-M14]